MLLTSLLFCATLSSAADRTPIRSSNATLISTGIVSMAGLNGQWRSSVDLLDGRFDVRADLGSYRIADIYDGVTRWRVEPSGGSHALDSGFAVETARTEGWLARFGWLRQPSRGTVSTDPIIRTVEGRKYSIRTVTPPGGRPVVLWSDVGSGEVARAELRGWAGTTTTYYGDYRNVSDLRLPFSIIVSDGNSEQTIRVGKYSLERREAVHHRFAPPPQPGDATVPSGGTTVPSAIFPQLVVQAALNGGKPMEFVFDTGGHSILTPEAAEAMGLAVVGETKSGGSGAGTITQRDTRVKELRIGDAVLRDQHFYVLSLGYSSMEQGSQPPLAGLLGLEVLERFIVRVNYRAGTLTLLPREAPIACAGVWQGVRFTDDMPTVEGALDGMPAKFTIDTGNNGTLQLYDHWLREHGLADRYRKGAETMSYGAGGPSRNWVSYARSVRLGGVDISRPMVRTTDDKAGVATSISETGNLGTALLANYMLTFDYARSRVCFDFVPGYVPVPFNRSGMRAVKTDPQAFTVSLVSAGSPAAIAGLSKGDRIVAVDGRPSRMLGGGDMTLALTRPPGTSVAIDYERAGELRHARVTLRELL